jgi:hypothetical protein
MKAYIQLLNALHRDGLLNLADIEAWWITRVKEYFVGRPFRVKVDASKSLRGIVSDLIESAFARQRECPGAMVAGALMQHLVGAKLDIAIPREHVEHKGFSVADAPEGRKGDFLVGDTAVHVTTAPSEGLIRKCLGNLADNLRPLVITSQSGVGGAHALAKNAGIADRIDILDIEQFVATNVYEWSAFRHAQRLTSIRQLIDAYNRIVESCETDPSLKIEIG